MTDKKKTILWLIEDVDALLQKDECATEFVIDSFVREGNSQMLVLREKSLSTANGIFNAVTSTSLIDRDDDLCQRML